MTDPNTNQVLEDLHSAVARELLQRVKSGDASTADLSAAAKFLKDNGIEAIPTPENPLGDLRDALPSFPNPQEITPQ